MEVYIGDGFTRKNTNNVVSIVQDRLKPVPVDEFSEHVQRMHADRDKWFELEYNVSQAYRNCYHARLCILCGCDELLWLWVGCLACKACVGRQLVYQQIHPHLQSTHL
jgi:hypothetical protein